MGISPDDNLDMPVVKVKQKVKQDKDNKIYYANALLVHEKKRVRKFYDKKKELNLVAGNPSKIVSSNQNENDVGMNNSNCRN